MSIDKYFTKAENILVDDLGRGNFSYRDIVDIVEASLKEDGFSVSRLVPFGARIGNGLKVHKITSTISKKEGVSFEHDVSSGCGAMQYNNGTPINLTITKHKVDCARCLK